MVPIGNPRRSARNPAVKWESAAFDAEQATRPGKDGAVGHRRNVDDVPAAASQHPGDGLPTQLGGGQVVNLGGFAKVVVGCVSEVGGGPNAGVVDQDVDRPRFVLDLIDEGGDTADVAAPPAAAPSGVVTFLFIDVEASTRRWGQTRTGCW
jgi:hypothetical protein